MSVEHGTAGSAAANQSKTESMPPTQGHADPEAPSHDSAAGGPSRLLVATPGTGSGPGDAAGVPVVSADPAEGSSEDIEVAQGTRPPL